MTNSIAYLKTIRQNISNSIEGLSTDQLLAIPEGFNNNLLWNACHVLVTQQLLVYKLSNQDLLVSQEMVDNYRKGTRPDASRDAERDLQYFHENYIAVVEQMEKDLESEKFSSYTEYTTSFGVTLHNVEEAVVFNNLHESMHLGYMLALKHVL